MTLWTTTSQIPLSMGFPRQEYRSGLLSPSPGNFLTQGLNLSCLHWECWVLATRPQGKSQLCIYKYICYVSVQFSHSVMSNSLQSRIAAHQASLSFTISHSLLKFTSIELVMPSNHLTLCRPFLLLPSIFPSIRVFSNESALHIRWPKYWSLTFSISPSNKYPVLISFRIDWFDLLAVQGTLKSHL